MKLTILGSSPASPWAGGACSGYLIQEKDLALLLDCGTGAMANLRKHFDYRKLSAVVISHMHPDHFFDLIPLRQGLKYEPYNGTVARPLLLLPPGGRRVLEDIALALGNPSTFFDDTFEVTEYGSMNSFALSPLTFHFIPVPHYIPSHAISIEATKKLTYSADTGPNEALIKFTGDADLFLCEATLLDEGEDPIMRGHLTAREAGSIARNASVKQFLVTHYWRGHNPGRTLKEAGDAFGRATTLVEEDQVYSL